MQGSAALQNELIDRNGVFQNAKKLDAINEGMPSTPGVSTGASSPMPVLDEDDDVGEVDE